MSSEIKGTEPQIPWRDFGRFRNVIVHGCLGVDLEAVWLVVEQDLPALTTAVNRMAAYLGRQTYGPERVLATVRFRRVSPPSGRARFSAYRLAASTA